MQDVVMFPKYTKLRRSAAKINDIPPHRPTVCSIPSKANIQLGNNPTEANDLSVRRAVFTSHSARVRI